jgi:hypothetical protein
MISTGKTCRAGADNRDLFLAWWLTRDLYFAAVVLIGSQTLQVANGDRFIDVTAAAGVFTPVRANSAQYAGQRQILHDNFQGFLVFAHFDHVDIALNVQTAGARQATRGFIAFFDGKSPGNRLGILFIGSFFGDKILLVFIRKIDGADLDTLTAAGAFGKVDVAGVFTNPGLEVSGFTVQCKQLAFG